MKTVQVATTQGGNQAETAEFVERTQCISCGAPDLTPLATGLFNEAPLCDFIANDPWGENPAPYLAGQRWTYVKCDRCDQAFHRSILAPQWNERRFSHWMTQEAIDAFDPTSRLPENLLRRAAEHTAHVLQLEKLTRPLRQGQAVRLLDFGCGYGEFLAMCDLYGFAAYGVDRSMAKRENGRFAHIVSELAGLDRLTTPQFHVITLFEVLEHLDDPKSILEILRQYLVVGGILVLETPDCTGVTNIVDRDDYLKIHPLDHINGFTPETLRRLAQSLGFVSIAKPISQVTSDLPRVIKTEAKRLVGRALKPTTKQYFRKR